MEDLKEYMVYRKWLLAGNVDEGLARKLARDLATIHHKTHVAKLSPEAFTQLQKEFRQVMTDCVAGLRWCAFVCLFHCLTSS